VLLRIQKIFLNGLHTALGNHWRRLGETRPKAPAGRLKGVMEVSEDVRGEIRNPPSSSDKQIFPFSLKYKEHPTVFSFFKLPLKNKKYYHYFSKKFDLKINTLTEPLEKRKGCAKENQHACLTAFLPVICL
jgi:hypothetical protein